MAASLVLRRGGTNADGLMISSHAERSSRVTLAASDGQQIDRPVVCTAARSSLGLQKAMEDAVLHNSTAPTTATLTLS